PAGTSKPEARAFKRRSQTHEYGAAEGTATMGRQHAAAKKKRGKRAAPLWGRLGSVAVSSRAAYERQQPPGTTAASPARFPSPSPAASTVKEAARAWAHGAIP